VSAPTPHLRPHADVAERVLLPGDPGRALRLAQQLTEGPRMLNHHRGLWGYTGPAADGAPLTVQSTGMGGPSAAIVAEELITLGARRLVRVGTCGALVEGLGLGDLIVVEAALCADGTSRALGADGRLAPDPALLAGLHAAGRGRGGVVASSDLFYDPEPERARRWTAEGALAVELECAALLAVAARRGVAAACVLAVTDLLAGGTRETIDAAGLEAAEAELGRVGAAALGVAG
jgi:DeoD family purine-nucleoside phosphorylase